MGKAISDNPEEEGHPIIVLYLLVLVLVLAMCVLAGRLLCSCDFNETVDLMLWKRRTSTPNADKAQRSSIDFLSPPQPSDGAIAAADADEPPLGACPLPTHGSTAMSTYPDNVPAAGTNTIYRTNGDGADTVNSSAHCIEAQGKSRSCFRPDNRANPTLTADDFATSCLPTLSDVETGAPAAIGINTALRGLAPLNRPVPGFMPRGTLGTGPISPLSTSHEPLVDEADVWEDIDGLPLRGRTQVFHMDASSVSQGKMKATPLEPTMPGSIPEAAGETWEDMDGLPLRGRTQIIRGGQSLLHATETDLQLAVAVATPAPKMVAATELTEPDFQSFDEFDFMAHRLKVLFADPGDSTGTVDLRGVAANANAIDVMPTLRQQSTTSTTSSVASIGCGSGYVDVMPPSRYQSNTSHASVDDVPRQLSWDLVDSTVEPVALRPASHQRNLAFGVRDSMIEDDLPAGRGEAMLTDTGSVYYNW